MEIERQKQQPVSAKAAGEKCCEVTIPAIGKN